VSGAGAPGRPIGRRTSSTFSSTPPGCGSRCAPARLRKRGTGFFGIWLVESFLHVNERLELGPRCASEQGSAGLPPEGSPPRRPGGPALRPGGDGRLSLPAREIRLCCPRRGRAEVRPRSPEDLRTRDCCTRRMLELTRRAGAGRFLLISSGAVYGHQPPEVTHLPDDYAGAPQTMEPGTAYGQSKRLSEFLCAAHGRRHGFVATSAAASPSSDRTCIWTRTSRPGISSATRLRADRSGSAGTGSLAARTSMPPTWRAGSG